MTIIVLDTIRSHGFTLIELLVVIAIIAILAAILFPVFQKVRANGSHASCASNIKQLTLGLTQYCQDADEAFPQWKWGESYQGGTGYGVGAKNNATTLWVNAIYLLVAAAQAAQEKADYDRLVALAGHAPNDPLCHRRLARWCQTHHHLSRAIFEWQEVLAALPQDGEAQHATIKLLQQRG